MTLLKVSNERGDCSIAEVEVSSMVPERFTVSIHGSNFEVIGVGTDSWLALLDARRQLEAAGWRLCCNASKRNAFASSMSRSMAGGLACYLVELGHPVSRSIVVGALEEVDCADAVEVATQAAFLRRWMRSCRPPLSILYRLRRLVVRLR